MKKDLSNLEYVKEFNKMAGRERSKIKTSIIDAKNLVSLLKTSPIFDLEKVEKFVDGFYEFEGEKEFHAEMMKALVDLRVSDLSHPLGAKQLKKSFDKFYSLRNEYLELFISTAKVLLIETTKDSEIDRKKVINKYPKIFGNPNFSNEEVNKRFIKYDIDYRL